MAQLTEEQKKQCENAEIKAKSILKKGDRSRTQIKSTYSGKRYAKKVAGLIRLIRFWVRWQKGG